MKISYNENMSVPSVTDRAVSLSTKDSVPVVFIRKKRNVFKKNNCECKPVLIHSSLTTAVDHFFKRIAKTYFVLSVLQSVQEEV